MPHNSKILVYDLHKKDVDYNKYKFYIVVILIEYLQHVLFA